MTTKFERWWQARDGGAYVIAEAGVNHGGEARQARRLIEAAARAGADGVKFQFFKSQSLVARGTPLAGYQRASDAADMASLLEALELSLKDLGQHKEYCERCGVDFLVTPFGEEEAAQAAALGGPALKLASTAVNDPPLLAAAVRTGLPILLSTGASTLEEIAESVRLVDSLEARERLMLLHCVSAYPALNDELRLRMIPRLSRLFGLPVGFSDHSRGVLAGAWGVALGARIVEKHLTLDRALPGPDQGWALEPEDFRRYVAHIRLFERARGKGELSFSEAEREIRAVARRSVVLTREAVAGEVLHADMLTLKRPGIGISPAEMPDLIGCKLRVSCPADTVLTWDLMERTQEPCSPIPLRRLASAASRS